MREEEPAINNKYDKYILGADLACCVCVCVGGGGRGGVGYVYKFICTYFYHSKHHYEYL